jgi:hypothetical protein
MRDTPAAARPAQVGSSSDAGTSNEDAEERVLLARAFVRPALPPLNPNDYAWNTSRPGFSNYCVSGNVPSRLDDCELLHDAGASVMEECIEHCRLTWVYATPGREQAERMRSPLHECISGVVERSHAPVCAHVEPRDQARCDDECNRSSSKTIRDMVGPPH